MLDQLETLEHITTHQMPELKKSNSMTGCVREKNSLSVCPKSAMISKNTPSRVKILREAEIDLSIQNNNVSLSNKVDAERTETNEDIDNHDTPDEENVQSLEYLLPLADPSTTRLNLTQNTSESTLLSPTLDSTELCVEADGNKEEGLPLDNNLFYDDILDTLPDFKCNESRTSFEVVEECLMLSSHEDTYDATCDLQTPENTNIGSDDSDLYFAIHQLRSCDQDFNANTCAEPDQSECFDPHLFIPNLQPDFPDIDANFQLAVSPKAARKTKSVTLVLDLDETLVHSTLESCDDASFSFSVFFNMKENMVYVRQRPYLQMFLERVAEMFNVVVFTASQSIYAEQLLDKLDPNGKIISHRAYRESCVCLDGNYVKDLTIFGVDLAKIAIIDNSPQVFQLQVNNGIPITSWFDDPSDHALISLLPFLETLADADDVRPLIVKRYGNKE